MKYLSDKNCENCVNWGVAFLRIVLAIILMYHGWGKLFADNSGLLVFFESTVLPWPGAMLILAGVLEFFGGLLLLLGLFTRLSATIVSLEWMVIILFIKLKAGFIALELDLLIFAVLVALSTLGGGKISLDYVFIARKESRKAQDLKKS